MAVRVIIPKRFARLFRARACLSGLTRATCAAELLEVALADVYAQGRRTEQPPPDSPDELAKILEARCRKQLRRVRRPRAMRDTHAQTAQRDPGGADPAECEPQCEPSFAPDRPPVALFEPSGAGRSTAASGPRARVP